MSTDRDKSGVYLDDFQVDARRALQRAAQLEFSAVEMGTCRGELRPQNLTASGRRQVRKFAESLGLKIAAWSASEFNLSGWQEIASQRHLDHAFRIMELAHELDVSIVTMQLGRIDFTRPDDLQRISELLDPLVDHADKLGRTLALDTHTDDARALYDLIRQFNCPCLKVCFDPARYIMEGDDPLAPIEHLADHIILSHIHDGKIGSSQRPGQETNLGDGQINLPEYLSYLKDADYHNHQIIRRPLSNQPFEDLRRCKTYLQSILH